MIGYTTLGVKDLDKAKTFYSELFADKGAKVQGPLELIPKRMSARCIIRPSRSARHVKVNLGSASKINFTALMYAI